MSPEEACAVLGALAGWHADRPPDPDDPAVVRIAYAAACRRLTQAALALGLSADHRWDCRGQGLPSCTCGAIQ